MGLPSNPDTDIWSSYKFHRIQVFLTNTMFIILAIPIVDESLTFQLPWLHNLLFHHPTLKKSFHFNIPHRYLAFTSDVDYINVPEDNDI